MSLDSPPITKGSKILANLLFSKASKSSSRSCTQVEFETKTGGNKNAVEEYQSQFLTNRGKVEKSRVNKRHMSSDHFYWRCGPGCSNPLGLISAVHITTLTDFFA
jgi:hypothetical protein